LLGLLGVRVALGKYRRVGFHDVRVTVPAEVIEGRSRAYYHIDLQLGSGTFCILIVPGIDHPTLRTDPQVRSGAGQVTGVPRQMIFYDTHEYSLKRGILTLYDFLIDELLELGTY
jgi:hypothetical protein